MPALVTSNRDLSDQGNRTQARYELNRALDRNDARLLADWARDWGEVALGMSDVGAAYQTPAVVTLLANQLARDAERLLAASAKEGATVADLADDILRNFRAADGLKDTLSGYEE